MNKQNNPDQSGFIDASKWLVIAAIVIAGVVANYYYSAVTLSLRLIGWIAVAAMCAGIALTTQAGRQFLAFAKESRTELRKVVWPTRDETVKTTLIIAAFVLLFGFILWGIDITVMWVIGTLTGQRG